MLLIKDIVKHLFIKIEMQFARSAAIHVFCIAASYVARVFCAHAVHV